MQPWSQPLLWKGGAGLPCTPLSPVYISANGGTASGHSFTFANAPIATALGDYVLVGVTVEDSVATSVTNVTVGGVAMTQWSPGNVTGVGTENLAFSFFYGTAGAHATTNIVATTTGSGSEVPTIYVWRLGGINLGSISTVTSPFATGTSATIGPIQVYTDGVTIGMTLTNMAALTSETWSGTEALTEDFDLLTTTTFARAAGFRISPTSSRSTDSFTATFSVSRNHIGGAISFRACAVTTWNPADLSADITLSNGNLTATKGSAVGNNAVRSTTSRSSGKLYVEFPIGANAGFGNTGVGAADAAAVLTSFGVSAVGGTCGFVGGGIYFNGAAISNFGTTINAGDVVSMAIDFVNSKVWYRLNGGNWNGDVIANQNPATNTGGVNIAALFPANAAYLIYCCNVNSAGPSTGIRTTNAQFGFAIPAGFTSWDGF